MVKVYSMNTILNKKGITYHMYVCLYSYWWGKKRITQFSLEFYLFSNENIYFLQRFCQIPNLV